jgi:hypothetical protein
MACHAVDNALFEQDIGQFGEDLSQHLLLAPVLEVLVHGHVVG